ncbi:MAG: DNA-processing protein DprA [Lachnospiraceae bacterium]|nr:DNA-processing protein DprA [Lachnospiraceae bacterium]
MEGFHGYTNLSEEERIYLNYLLHVPGFGKKSMKSLLGLYGSMKDIMLAGKEDLCFAIGEDLGQMVWYARKTYPMEAEFKKLQENGIHLVMYGEQEYPSRLLDLADAPMALYYKGSLPAEEKKSVAIIGARNCTSYGRYAAEEYGYALAKAGVQIISGMALGVDGIAQQAAFAAGGTSYGVLGCSVDVCYPKCNRPLYDSLATKGGLISEYVPTTQPIAKLFAPRNRIISGLADLVLVVEAKVKSGTSITVDMALDQGREVFALPGRNCDVFSAGCNKLIKQGAGMACSPDDVLLALGLKEAKTGPHKKRPKLEKEQEAILSILDTVPMGVDEILSALREKSMSVTIQEVLCQLLVLTAMDLVEQVGGMYVLKNFS